VGFTVLQEELKFCGKRGLDEPIRLSGKELGAALGHAVIWRLAGALVEVTEGAVVSWTSVWDAAGMFLTFRMMQSSGVDLWDFGYLECAPAEGNSTQSEGKFFGGLGKRADGCRGEVVF
jgi:hypothetical protein